MVFANVAAAVSHPLLRRLVRPRDMSKASLFDLFMGMGLEAQTITI
jgi:hypothetical protein